MFIRYGTQDQWSENGIALYYTFEDIQRYGMWGESAAPWTNILEKMKIIARKHNQLYLYYYYPHIWNINGNAVLIQQVDATRTGLSMIHSKIPVDIEKFKDENFIRSYCNGI